MKNHLNQIPRNLNINSLPFNIKDPQCYTQIGEKIGNAQIVLLGEATHGTYEFYYVRQKLSEYLIKEKGFTAIAVEGDFTSCCQINRYIHENNVHGNLMEAFSGFKRFPAWMWRNEIMLPFIQYLHNLTIEGIDVQFYGLDLYSLHAAITAILKYLRYYHPQALKLAIQDYACLKSYSLHPEEYGALVSNGLKESCSENIIRQINVLRQLALKNMPNLEEANELFYAIQNANLVKNAELYYRAMFSAQYESWNVRDNFMFETLQNIRDHLANCLKVKPKIIVWAHNSHVGNALATDMGAHGEYNLGQLVKSYYKESSFSLGFSTYTGSVLAASEWGESPEEKPVTPGLPGSYEKFFHNMADKNFILFLNNNQFLQEVFPIKMLQRAIGVVYKPKTERYSHYYYTDICSQFDALIHLDVTWAIKPIG